MFVENLLNNLFEIFGKNLDNLNIKYSNTNGKESLIVNGKEMLPQFNDERIKNKIKTYKENLDSLDDCIFVDVIESLEDKLDFCQMNNLLDQESFTQAEANLADDLMKEVNEMIVLKLNDKIQELCDIREKFL